MMTNQVAYTLNLIEARSLTEYKGQPISNIEWDASYDAYMEFDPCTNKQTEHRIESIEYHPDLDEVMESEALTAIEEGLCNFLKTIPVFNSEGTPAFVDTMILNVEFTDHKNGTPTYRILTRLIVE